MMKIIIQKISSCLMTVLVIMLSVTVTPLKTAATSTTSLPATVSGGMCGDNLTWTLDSNRLLTINGTGDMWDYDYYDTPLWHNDRDRITTVQINNGVTSIGDGAFSSCPWITSIVIPESVTSIGDSAFKYCNLLRSIVIPDGVTSIGTHVFESCNALTNIVIPEGVTSIGDSAFEYCPALKSIVIPESVTSIGDSAFAYCRSLRSIVIPEGVTSIGDSAFVYCRSLRSIVIPEGVTSIRNSAFAYCDSLTNIVIPESVTSIGDSAFVYCKSLRSIVIPEGVTSIRDNAFERCNNLTIFGNSGSYAERYASKNRIPFVVRTPCEDEAHTYGAWTTIIYPTCTEQGIEKRECTSTSCLASETREVKALDHDFDTEWTIDVPATETTAGSKSRHCKRSSCDAKTDVTEIPPTTRAPDVTECFVDIAADAWYVSAVQYAVDHNLFNGISETKFAPSMAMNRAMLVTVLWRMEGQPTVSVANPFNDVPTNEWYTDAVLWASSNDIVNGIGDGKFNPKGDITREQMATILYRYAEKKGYNLTASTNLNAFPDGAKTSDYAKTALSWACGNGLIAGSDGKLLPQDGATRAQVATILMRYGQNIAK